jgi:hypothetical protein
MRWTCAPGALVGRSLRAPTMPVLPPGDQVAGMLHRGGEPGLEPDHHGLCIWKAKTRNGARWSLHDNANLNFRVTLS